MRNISVNLYVSMRSEALGVVWSKKYFENLITRDSQKVLLSGFGEIFGHKVSLDYLTYFHTVGVFGGEKEPSAIISFLRAESLDNVLPEEILFVLLVAARLTQYLGQLSVLVELDLGGEIIYVMVENLYIAGVYALYTDALAERRDPREWALAAGEYISEMSLPLTGVEKYLRPQLFKKELPRGSY